MTAVTKPDATAPTAVAKRIDENVLALRERNAMVAQIRGTQWGLGIDSRTTKAVAHYCLTMGLDPVRHVEVLGGRIYLTAEFYQERGARLIRQGLVTIQPSEFINADPRLEQLTANPDQETAAWAKGEIVRRTKLRIEHNAPEDAKAIAVQRITVVATGMQVTGVNWCGVKAGKKDPVGDAEPTKTALTRAARRAWKQVADVIPGYGAEVKPIEEEARLLNGDLDPADEIEPEPPRPLLTGQSAEIAAGSEHPAPYAPAAEPRAVLRLPSWTGYSHAGEPIASVPTPDLEAIFLRLQDQPKYSVTADAIALVLEDRRGEAA